MYFWSRSPKLPGDVGQVRIAGVQVLAQVQRLQNAESGLFQGVLVGLEAEVGIEVKAVVDVGARRFADVRLGLDEVIEDEQPALGQHPVSLPQRGLLVRYVVDGGLAPNVAEGVVLKGEVRGRRLLKTDAVSEGRRRSFQVPNGVVDAHTAQVHAHNAALAGAAQPHGRVAVAAPYVQKPGAGEQPGLVCHELIEVGARLEEVLPGALVKEAPVQASLGVPEGAIQLVFGVVEGLRDVLSEPSHTRGCLPGTR